MEGSFCDKSARWTLYCLGDKRLELIQVQTTSSACELAANRGSIFEETQPLRLELIDLSASRDCLSPNVGIHEHSEVYQSSFINDRSLSGFQELFTLLECHEMHARAIPAVVICVTLCKDIDGLRLDSNPGGRGWTLKEHVKIQYCPMMPTSAKVIQHQGCCESLDMRYSSTFLDCV